jgi:hypothetical protein
MNIADIREWGKARIGQIPAHTLTVLILVLSSTASFGLGILAGKDMEVVGGGEELWIEDRTASSTGLHMAPSALPAAAVLATPGVVGVGYVASKSGTKYYLPTCSGVARIKEANKVWYATKEDAESAGLAPAANCPGL